MVYSHTYNMEAYIQRQRERERVHTPTNYKGKELDLAAPESSTLTRSRMLCAFTASG